MIKVYFVRHAESDYSIHDDYNRPLTRKGMSDSEKITDLLINKNINRIFSSPYKRAIDTIAHLADKTSLNINIIDNFRERSIGEWIEDFNSFSRKQWEDFNYKTQNSESLKEVQKRNVAALMEILKAYDNENIVIATHGTALSTIINYYNNDFGYEDFEKLRPIMPYVICFTFMEGVLIDSEVIDV